MKYVKPEFMVEEFELNETIAGCNRVQTDTVEVYEAQTIDCFITTSADNVFTIAENSTCQMSVSTYHFVTVEAGSSLIGDYSSGGAALDALLDYADPSNNFNFPDRGSARSISAGQVYFLWKDSGSGHGGGQWHGGLATSGLQAVYGYSF